MVDGLSSLGFRFFVFKQIYYRKILLIASLQVVIYSWCHLGKSNCFIIRIKDESDENVYYLGQQETQNLVLFQLRTLSCSPMQQVLFDFKSL